MVTLVPWATIEVGDLEIFAPAVPCLLVNTWYTDDGPESTVTHFWQDEATGLVNHELVFAEPADFATALAWAREHAPKREIERIHVRHGPPQRKRARKAAKPVARKKLASRRKARAVPKARSKKRRQKTPAR